MAVTADLARGPMRYAELPQLDPRIEQSLRAAWWPLARLGEALEALSRASGLCASQGNVVLMPPRTGTDGGQDLQDWFDWAGEMIGVEAEPVHATVAGIDDMLLGGGPAIVMHALPDGPGFLLLLKGRRRHLARFLGPDLSVEMIPAEWVSTALSWAIAAPLIPQIDRLLEISAIPAPRRMQVRGAMLRERLSRTQIDNIWLVRLPASEGLWRHLVWEGVPAKIAGVLLVFCAVYGLEILSWTLIGGAALDGRLDFGWLAAWLLLVLTLVPLRLAGGWLEAAFSIDCGRILKTKLLSAALKLDPERVTRQGVGHLIGRVMEAQALETLALNGGMAVIVSGLELLFAAWILSHGAAPGAHIALLTLAAVPIAWLGRRYWARLAEWSRQRLVMTNSLIEGMIGHRTRLAQERAGRRDAAEDRELNGYTHSSRSMDGAGVIILAGLPSGAILLGLLGLMPGFIGAGAQMTPAMLAISIGGMLLAQRALAGMAGGLSSLARAGIAWRQVVDLVKSGGTDRRQRPFLDAAQTLPANSSLPLVKAHGLQFRYDPDRAPVLDNVDLTIARGERILLEGPSGGGKSTLAALLTGLRTPQSGLVLLNGLDRHTLGDDWRKFVTAAPQFQENHILSGPLAFNLLMGRRWPPSKADLAQAEALCEELGLGALLRRMPAGILQRVGETGWQLSHGERSRIFLARALLQGAELTILDESFAALDPETLSLCLRAAIKHARALIVIAHP